MRRFDAGDLDALLNAAARGVTAGGATDWGLRAGVVSAVPPISLGGGIPDPASLAREELRGALSRALTTEDEAPLTYGGPFGSEALRTELAARAGREQDLDLDAGWFMLTNGTAGAIEAVCRTFVGPGDVVITESPTFMGSVRTFRGYQAEVVGVPLDVEGIDASALAATLERLRREGKRAKLIYTIASFQNPTGVTLSARRREQLVALAAEHGALILEDDAYGEIRFASNAPRSLAAIAKGEGVIVAGSFSKSIATGLRVGWLQASPALLERVARMRFDMGGTPLLQTALAELMADGSFASHVDRVRPLYARKLEALAHGLIEHAEPYLTFARPRGGFFLWVQLRDGLTAEAVQRAAIEEGVTFPLGLAFFPERVDPQGEHIRLSYSYASEDELREAAARLGRACERAAHPH